MHIAGGARNIERLAAIITFHNRDHLRGHLALIHETTHAQRALQAERNFGHRIGEFLLDQLCLGQWLAELHAIQRILTGAVHAIFSCPENAPRNAVASAIEAAKRAFQSGNIRQQMLFANNHVFHHDFTRDRCAQRQFAVNLGGRKTFHALFKNETANVIIVRGGLCPDDEHVGDRRIRNPHFRAIELITVSHLLDAGFHARRIGPCIRLGEAEAADPLARGEFRQIFLALGITAIGVDRIHDERRLNAHHRAIA